jgi:hypothetical protein
MFRSVITAIIRLCCNNIKGGTEVEASPSQLKHKLITMLLYQKWDNKLYSRKIVKKMKCAGT